MTIAPDVLAPARRSSRIVPWVSTLARLVLGSVLLVAGGLKVIDPQSSVQAVRAYELLPDLAARIVGWGLPFAEIAVGLLLMAGLLTRPAAIAAGAMLVVFLVAVGSAAARGLSIDCGCFGGGGPVAPGQTAYGAEIVRDLALLAVAVWLIRHPRSRYALDHDDTLPDDPAPGDQLESETTR